MAHRLHRNYRRNLLRQHIQMANNADVAVYDVVQLLEGVHLAVTETSIELADALVNEK